MINALIEAPHNRLTRSQTLPIDFAHKVLLDLLYVYCGIGGVDSPVGATNAGPHFPAERNATPLFPLTVVQDNTPHPERSSQYSIRLKY